jgi:hypothetical protein
VRITVQSDAGSIKSYDNINKSRQETPSKSSNNLPHQDQQKKGLNSNSTNSMGFDCDVRAASIASYNSDRARTSSKTRSHNSANEQVNNLAKPGAEVLTLIATWIKNSPNDFLGKIFFYFFLFF